MTGKGLNIKHWLPSEDFTIKNTIKYVHVNNDFNYDSVIPYSNANVHVPQISGGLIEIASEAILEQKQSCSSYMAHRVLHPSFSCPYMHLLSQVTLNFHKRWLAEQQVGVITDGEIVRREY